MCGIVGIYCFDRARPVDPRRLAEMNDSLYHRGPDDGGLYVGQGFGFAHRRLSIIDLGGGHQPMWDRERRIGVVFNGEIYNYRELKKHLQERGHRFATDSDTEVIIHGYREWGAACVDHFVGMFAFAVADQASRTLFLARDRLGKKPLYYFQDNERVIFASEIKAILADPSVPRILEPQAVADFFAYSYVPGPGSILRNIHKLPAGHTLLLTEAGAQVRRYWDIDFEQVDETSNLEAQAQRLLDSLQEAVKLRLRSDVPLGAFLSGGVDSSMIVALMARQLDRPVQTHTIGFTESTYDERAYAAETAQLYGTAHTEKVVNADAAAILERLSWHYDEPFGDSSAVPTYYLSQSTREHLTVALSGDGGDENFAGYRRYVFAMRERAVRERLPGVLQNAVIRPLAELYPKADYLPRYLRAKATLTNLAVSHERAYFLSLTQKTYPRLLAASFLEGLGDYDPYVHFERHLARAPRDPLSRLQYLDLKLYLCDDILVKVDRASMAHALEVRVPLLDHRVVEQAARLPARYKLRGDETKVVLKRAAEKLLPQRILQRTKMGFTIPLPEWLRGGLQEAAQTAFFERSGGISGLLNTNGLRRMWYEHQLGVSNHATVLWNALMLESWASRYLAQQVAPPALPHNAKRTLAEAQP